MIKARRRSAFAVAGYMLMQALAARVRTGELRADDVDPEPTSTPTGRPLTGCKDNPDYKPAIRYYAVRGPTKWGIG